MAEITCGANDGPLRSGDFGPMVNRNDWVVIELAGLALST